MVLGTNCQNRVFCKKEKKEKEVGVVGSGKERSRDGLFGILMGKT